jgi:hypothetical protein
VYVGVVGPGFVVEIVIRTRVRDDVPLPFTIENVAAVKPNGDAIVVITIPGPILPETGDGAFQRQKEGAQAGVIPEPSTLVLLGGGLAILLAGLRLRARRR